MSRKWFAARFGIISIVVVLILVAAGVVMAVQQSDPFELDGNAVDDSGGGVDWSNIYAPQTDAAEGRSAFVVDSAGPNADNIFTGGGSKDISEISEWKYETGNVPDKDDILDAYAAAYDVNGSLTIYFGADRFANNGDAQIGIWLFQNKVQMQPDGSFSGSHSDNDLLVLSNFVGGGKTSNIQVYRWNGQADPANPLLLVAEATADGALSVCTDDDLACAFTNAGGESSPWPYSPKSGSDGAFPEVSFFEGGVDIGALLGPDGLGCYSTFLMETRTSQEPTAQLKDFTTGSLALCDLTIILTGSENSKVTDLISYTATIENTGLVTLYRQDIGDTVLGDLSSLASDVGCDTLAPGKSCQFTFDYTVQDGDPDPFLNTLTAAYQTGSGDEVSGSDDHETNLFQPSIAFTNVGSKSSVVVGDKVTYTLTVENTSSADSPNLICEINDEQLGIHETVNLAPGEQHTVTGEYTAKASDPATLTNHASVHCQVDGFPNTRDAESDFNLSIGAAPQSPTDSPTAEPTIQHEDNPAPTAAPTKEPTQQANTNQQPPKKSSPEPQVAQTTQEQSFDQSAKGCSPGFWQGGYGRWLWNDVNDPDWKGQGTNPFTHETAFNTVFAAHPPTDGMVMFNFVRGGGGPLPWRKAGRNVVAGYLNASYGMNYPYTPQQIVQMWADAVNGTRSFMDVHQTLGKANNLGCPIGK